MSALLPDGMRVRWLGHSVFDFVGPTGQRFLIDPFIEENPAFPKHLAEEVKQARAYQAMLITHPHFDHFQDALPLLKNDPALKVICQFEIGGWLQGQGVKEDQIIAMNTGGTLPFGDVRITMVPAVHSSSVSEKGAPRALGFPIGYVLRFSNGFTIYDTGDTTATMDMQIVRDLYKPDLVILPIGDFYTMGPELAAYSLNLLQPRLAIGCHWGTWDGKPPGRPEMVEKELARYQISTKLVQLKPGETLS